MERGIATLVDLGAAREQPSGVALTPLGSALSLLPVELTSAKMLLLGPPPSPRPLPRPA